MPLTSPVALVLCFDVSECSKVLCSLLHNGVVYALCCVLGLAFFVCRLASTAAFFVFHFVSIVVVDAGIQYTLDCSDSFPPGRLELSVNYLDTLKASVSVMVSPGGECVETEV
jgi:hypothetical protein